jgi:hypothetical protein
VSDRLKDLQRQRALAQEQLAWLDREIAAASGGTQHAPPAIPPPGQAVPASAEAAAAAEAIIAKYQRDPAAVQGHVKRGCYVYFILAFVLVGLGLLALYLHTIRK